MYQQPDEEGGPSVPKESTPQSQLRRTKHVEVHYHFIREKVLQEEIEMRQVKTNDQVADLFTKSLSTGKLENFRCLLSTTEMELDLVYHFHGFEPYFYINYSPKIAPDDISRFHRILEPWVMKRETVIGKKNCHQILTEVGLRNLFVPIARNAKQPTPKPVDMCVSSNNLVKDGVRGSDAFYGGGSDTFYGGGSCSSSGKIPWGRFELLQNNGQLVG
ncbi:hypothetical protein D8674_013024 [Pyrus ussuriensis x Pyrus communis]|uniref:Uncharacterized protein n=1 Tax=Pyrus ussuriensis x Pyrus communis TaxID=2448454 RepID=A0A5N5GNK7_9ROSA|nr:hypothetical protein D8674_013024 [Pyrus ussuriensis x Pyrus communis]